MFKFEIETLDNTALSDSEYYDPSDAEKVAEKIWAKVSPKDNVIAVRVLEQDGTVHREWKRNAYSNS
jgi:hypothetical protein